MEIIQNVPAGRNTLKRGTLKGFTLIELIIVIAILSILIGMISLFMPGFIRDANIESNNKKAKVAYTGFQDMLINWEISQDDSIVNADAFQSSPSYSTEPLTYVEIQYAVLGDIFMDNILIKSYYDNSSTDIVDVELKEYPGTTDETEKKIDKAYKSLRSLIQQTHGGGLDGNFWVFVDYENYCVDSVQYVPNSELTGAVTASEMRWADSEDIVNEDKKSFWGCPNIDTQVLWYKENPIHPGFYPFAQDIREVEVVN